MANCKTTNTDTAEQTILNQLRDISHLQIPLKLSDTVDKFLKAIEDGTNEVKFLLTKECDLLVECKVCKQIYRSLVNFIEHKRHYCTDIYDYHLHFISKFVNNVYNNDNNDTSNINKKSNSDNTNNKNVKNQNTTQKTTKTPTTTTSKDNKTKSKPQHIPILASSYAASSSSSSSIKTTATYNDENSINSNDSFKSNDNEEITKKPGSKNNASKSEQDIVQQKHSVIGSSNSLTLRNRSLFKNLDFTKPTETSTTGTSKRIRSKRTNSNDKTNKKKKIEINDHEEDTIEEYLAENESEIENKIEKKVINKSINQVPESSISTSIKMKAEITKVISTSANNKVNDISDKNPNNPGLNCVVRLDKNLDSIIGKLVSKKQNSKEPEIFKEKEKEAVIQKEKETEKEKQKMSQSKINLKNSPIKSPIEQKDNIISYELKETSNEKSPILTSLTIVQNVQNNKVNSNEIIKKTQEEGSIGLILIDDDDDEHKNVSLKETPNTSKESEIKNVTKKFDEIKSLPEIESKDNKILAIADIKDNKNKQLKYLNIAQINTQNQEKLKPHKNSMSGGEDDDDVFVLEEESSTPNRSQITNSIQQNKHHKYLLSPSISSASSQAVQFNSFINRQRNSSQSIMYSQNFQTFNQTNFRAMQLPTISNTTALISNQGILIPTNQQNMNNFYTPNRYNSQIINNHQNRLFLVPNFNAINMSQNIANTSSNNLPMSSNSSHNSSINNQQAFLTPVTQQNSASSSNTSNSGSAFKLYNNITHD